MASLNTDLTLVTLRAFLSLQKSINRVYEKYDTKSHVAKVSLGFFFHAIYLV